MSNLVTLAPEYRPHPVVAELQLQVYLLRSLLEAAEIQISEYRAAEADND